MSGPFAGFAMLTALGLGFLFVFGKVIVGALVVSMLWPIVFTQEFTLWVFGAPTLAFWRAFLLLLGDTAVFNVFRRQSWQKK